MLAAQAAGILCADRGMFGVASALCIGTVALGLGLTVLRVRWGAALVLAFAAGVGSMGELRQAAARAERLDPRECVVEGTVVSVSRNAQGWRVVLEDVRGVGPVRPPLPRRVRLSGRATPEGIPAFEAVWPGDRVRALVRLRPVAGLRNPGSRDPAVALRRKGIGLIGRLAHPALHAVVEPPAESGTARSPWLQPARVVHGVRVVLAERLVAAGHGGALLAALALGDRAKLSADERAAFARLGVAHLLAVSGLHLALVAVFVYGVSRRVLARVGGLRWGSDVRPASVGLACLAALGFALLAGWGVPVRRAWVLLLALGAGAVRSRPTARLAPLAAAGVWILGGEPGALFAPGAQLSFAASAGLLLGASQGQSGRGWAPSGFVAATLHTTAMAIAVTAPLAAWHLGTRAPLALVANLLLVPWTGLVLLPAALVAAAGAGVGGAGGTALLEIAEAVAAITLLAVGRLAAVLPGDVGAPVPSAAWICGAAVLGAFVLRSRRLLSRVVGAAGVSVVLAIAPPAPQTPAPPRVVFFDVGAGDAAVVQGRGGAVLVDGGVAVPDGFDAGRHAVVPALRSLGVARLDLVVASHADLDHRGGLPAVLDAFPVDTVWLPRGGARDPGFAALRASAERHGVPVHERGLGDRAQTWGDVRVVPLWPPWGGSGSRNDRSLVVRVETAGYRVLFPGDLEAAGEVALLANGVDLASDILKLPHHGSRSSTTAPWLAAVGPRLAVASAPCRGRFAWPHAEVVTRLRDRGVALGWTGRDGAFWAGFGARLTFRGTGIPRRCPETRR